MKLKFWQRKFDRLASTNGYSLALATIFCSATLAAASGRALLRLEKGFTLTSKSASLRNTDRERLNMKISELAAKVSALPPRPSFTWPGPEQYHENVFAEHCKTLPDAVAYIDKLRDRMAEYSMALHSLCDCYDKLRAAVLEASVE